MGIEKLNVVTIYEFSQSAIFAYPSLPIWVLRLEPTLVGIQISKPFSGIQNIAWMWFEDLTYHASVMRHS